jgi:hypothetical protein
VSGQDDGFRHERAPVGARSMPEDGFGRKGVGGDAAGARRVTPQETQDDRDLPRADARRAALS